MSGENVQHPDTETVYDIWTNILLGITAEALPWDMATDQCCRKKRHTNFTVRSSFGKSYQRNGSPVKILQLQLELKLLTFMFYKRVKVNQCSWNSVAKKM